MLEDPMRMLAWSLRWRSPFAVSEDRNAVSEDRN
jgi:hypothetical protein